jgi:molybdate transport system regulatory protein
MDRSKNGPQYRLKLGESTIFINKKKFKLLKFIDECGSIMEASKRADISYRSSLKYIEELEGEINKSIVTTKRGGKGGGGESKLTEDGKLILKQYKKVESILKIHTDVNEIEGNIEYIDSGNKIASIYLSEKKVILPLRGDFKVGDRVLVLISPKDIFVMLKPQESSARNIFSAKITKMELKDQLVRLNVDMGNITLFADVTEQSSDKLNLTLGKEVFIGFKAAAIVMIKI